MGSGGFHKQPQVSTAYKGKQRARAKSPDPWMPANVFGFASTAPKRSF